MHIVYKHVGETPLQCIKRLFNTEKKSYTYAGRLDPMAEGLLIVLEGEECKDAKEYHDLNKTYEYSFIVGIGTDTYDGLGKITKFYFPEKEIAKEIKEIIATFTQKQTLPYPPYSSKTINGTPLFEYARKNKIKEITLPTKTVHITNHEVIDIKIVETKTTAKEIIEKIKRVGGDFRQQEIINKWKQVKNHKTQQFFVKIEASSGTYVRAIVHEIGGRIGYPTVTTSIKRTKIGTWLKVGHYGQ